MLCTQDLTFVIQFNFLSRFMSRPDVKHICAAKRVVKYLARTSVHGLLYSHKTERSLEGYTNND